MPSLQALGWNQRQPEWPCSCPSAALRGAQQLPQAEHSSPPRAPSHGSSPDPARCPVVTQRAEAVPTQNLSTIHSITQESHPEIAHY